MEICEQFLKLLQNKHLAYFLWSRCLSELYYNFRIDALFRISLLLLLFVYLLLLLIVFFALGCRQLRAESKES